MSLPIIKNVIKLGSIPKFTLKEKVVNNEEPLIDYVDLTMIRKD